MRLLAALAAAALAGCFAPTTPNPSDVEITDRSAFVPVVRIGGNFVSEANTPPSHAQGGHGIELGATRVSGDGTQATSASQPAVVFGGRTFVPGQQLRNEFDFAFYDLSYRWRRYLDPGRTFAIETLAGIGAVRLDVTVASSVQSARESLDSAGFAGALGFVWRFRPSTSVQSRFMLYASGDSDGIANAERLELYLVQAIGRNLALRAGYAAWHAETDADNGNRSNVKLKFSGPALGLDLVF